MYMIKELFLDMIYYGGRFFYYNKQHLYKQH